MLQKIAAAALSALVCLSFAACGQTGTASSVPSVLGSSQSSLSALPGDGLSSVVATAPAEMFTDRDLEVGYSDYATVTLSDQGSSSASKSVTIRDNIVTITGEGTYLLTGTLTGGQVVVDVGQAEKVQLVLDNASITSPSSAALYVKQADKVFVTLAKDSVNTLRVTGDYVQTDDNNIDAALFSKADLTLNGNGSLTVDAASGHGVVSKDDLVVASGTYAITAASHGLSGKDSVRIAGGDFTITSGKDGIHAENKDDTTKGFLYILGGSFHITSTGDGMDAGLTLEIDGGTFAITSGGGSANASTTSGGQANGAWGQWGQSSSGSTASDSTASAKGVKSAGALTIGGGTFEIDSSDDAVHTNGDLLISGGSLSIASGDDGVHADSAVSISDGTVAISKSYEGIEGQTITISGGSISLTASDDGINAAGGNDGSSLSGRPGQNTFSSDSSVCITISGGQVLIDAGGDGIDSNGKLLVTGGTVYVSGPTNSGNGALDYDSEGTITGGTVIALGSSGMSQNFGSTSTQGSILYNLSSAQSAGTKVTLTDSTGSVLAEYTSSKSFQCVVISAPGVQSDGSYTLTVGSQSYPISMTGLIYGSGGMGGGKPSGARPGKTGVPQ